MRAWFTQNIQRINIYCYIKIQISKSAQSIKHFKHLNKTLLSASAYKNAKMFQLLPKHLHKALYMYT